MADVRRKLIGTALNFIYFGVLNFFLSFSLSFFKKKCCFVQDMLILE